MHVDNCQVLLDAIADPWANRDEIAKCYAAVIRYDPTADWPYLNQAVLRRYTEFGLEYIKRKAWEYSRGL